MNENKYLVAFIPHKYKTFFNISGSTYWTSPFFNCSEFFFRRFLSLFSLRINYGSYTDVSEITTLFCTLSLLNFEQGHGTMA